MLEKRLNGNQLKLIAVLSMIIDHIGYAWFYGPLGQTMEATLESPTLYKVYIGLRLIGRIAFPVFAYLLVEGFFHTRSRKKYILRMGIFALISEIPFDLFISGSLVYPWHQNVFFTFVIGLGMMAVMEEIRRRIFGEWGLILQLLAVIAASWFAWVFCTDYQFCGIMLIAIFYWFYGKPWRQCLLGFIWQMNTEEREVVLGLVVSFLILGLYNGEQGKRKFGYIFYLFYPVHLLIFSGIYIFL